MTSKIATAAALLLVGLGSAAAADEEPIPRCAEPMGTVALREPDRHYYWWRDYNLENPEALIKYIVNESGCFTMVDRGDGLEMP